MPLAKASNSQTQGLELGKCTHIMEVSGEEILFCNNLTYHHDVSYFLNQNFKLNNALDNLPGMSVVFDIYSKQFLA
jgi:hypothetical protein